MLKANANVTLCYHKTDSPKALKPFYVQNEIELQLRNVCKNEKCDILHLSGLKSVESSVENIEPIMKLFSHHQ